MKRVLAVGLTICVVAFAGCNQKPADMAVAERQQTVEGAKVKYTEACINGVVYYRIFRVDAVAGITESIAPAFGIDSKVTRCPIRIQ